MKKYKFSEILNTKFKDYMDVLKKLRAYTSEATRLLGRIAEGDDFLSTSAEFSNLSSESLTSILDLLEKGYFAICEISTRWYLELCYVYMFLWQNPKEYEQWLSGKQMRPKDVGKYFQQRGLDTGRATYEALSNATHCNDTFINYYGLRALDTPVNEFQIHLLGNLLVHLIIASHRINYVSYQNIKPHIGGDARILEERHKALETKISELARMFNEKESAYIKKVLADDH